MSDSKTNGSKRDRLTKQGSWLTSINEKGEYVRKASVFRSWITDDGSSPFPAEPGRYHLYVSHACPWAHRTLITRALLGLEDVVSVDVVDWYLGEGGWRFKPDVAGATADSVNGASFLKEVYLKADPEYSRNITVPVLWDKKAGTVVSNESAEIIRMLHALRPFSSSAEKGARDLYPEDLREQVDELNEFVYHNVNNGVYRCGFARSQEAYEKAFDGLFEALDVLEERLGKSRFLFGNRLTEADIRLFTTLVRFDPVYVQHFKTNLRRLVDYPNLWGFTKDVFQLPGVASTVNLTHIKHHYCVSHTSINPLGIVPKGPAIDFAAAHDRDRLGPIEGL
eukprot:CAMPEP_0196776460 /NCGR_PEP_ID=MMETSP1104-20130614/4636_1 /TAXON_ID=33652 /ORGANISM="Cafeteria sp., Strain Caron Lab Isolate" /LENGTH=336 /DNA_ID=CAMNT_0042146629 /DNA_START=99 /DNA_END=1109 /DNA_ORIENTATION=+